VNTSSKGIVEGGSKMKNVSKGGRVDEKGSRKNRFLCVRTGVGQQQWRADFRTGGGSEETETRQFRSHGCDLMGINRPSKTREKRQTGEILLTRAGVSL